MRALGVVGGWSAPAGLGLEGLGKVVGLHLVSEITKVHLRIWEEVKRLGGDTEMRRRRSGRGKDRRR